MDELIINEPQFTFFIIVTLGIQSITDMSEIQARHIKFTNRV